MIDSNKKITKCGVCLKLHFYFRRSQIIIVLHHHSSSFVCAQLSLNIYYIISYMNKIEDILVMLAILGSYE